MPFSFWNPHDDPLACWVGTGRRKTTAGQDLCPACCARSFKVLHKLIRKHGDFIIINSSSYRSSSAHYPSTLHPSVSQDEKSLPTLPRVLQQQQCPVVSHPHRFFISSCVFLSFSQKRFLGFDSLQLCWYFFFLFFCVYSSLDVLGSLRLFCFFSCFLPRTCPPKTSPKTCTSVV